jgi:hypothetical protein
VNENNLAVIISWRSVTLGSSKLNLVKRGQFILS